MTSQDDFKFQDFLCLREPWKECVFFRGETLDYWTKIVWGIPPYLLNFRHCLEGIRSLPTHPVRIFVIVIAIAITPVDGVKLTGPSGCVLNEIQKKIKHASKRIRASCRFSLFVCVCVCGGGGGGVGVNLWGEHSVKDHICIKSGTLLGILGGVANWGGGGRLPQKGNFRITFCYPWCEKPQLNHYNGLK